MYRKYSGHVADGAAAAAGRCSEDDGSSAAVDVGGGDGDAAAARGQVGNGEDVSLTTQEKGIGARSAPDVVVGVW